MNKQNNLFSIIFLPLLFFGSLYFSNEKNTKVDEAYRSKETKIFNRANDSTELVRLYELWNGNDWTYDREVYTQRLVGGWRFSTTAKIPNSGNKWDFSKPVDTWHGVTLNENGCVDTLLLLSNGLKGNITDINLPEVVSVLLSFNDLEGALVDFQGIPNINELGLEDNSLTGNLVDFSNMPFLNKLWLDRNQLIGGLIDFQNIPNLRILDLSNNDLGGPMIDFSGLPNIEAFAFIECELSGVLPTLTQMPKLYHVMLSSNNLEGFLPDLSNLTLLNRLYLSNNNFEGNIPDFSAHKDRLLYLLLNSNEFIGNAPDFSNFERLSNLSLADNKLEGIIPDFNNCPQLGFVSYAENNFLSPIPRFNDSPLLRILNLSNNQFSENLPEHILSLKNLRDLNLSNNFFVGCFPNTYRSFCEQIDSFATLNINTSFLFDENQGLPGNGDFASFCNLNIGNCGGEDLSWQWSTDIGSKENDFSVFASSLELDNYGNLFSVGTLEDTTNFNNQLINVNNRDAFIKKTNLDGTLDWIKFTKGRGLLNYPLIKSDDKGLIYFAATYSNSDVELDGWDLSEGTRGFFIVKMENEGRILAVKKFEGSYRLRDLEIDKLGNLYITGGFTSTINLGCQELESAESSYNGFILKMDKNFTCQWSKIMGYSEENSDEGISLAIDSNGSVFLGGRVWGEDNGFQLGNNSFEGVNDNRYDLFLIKLEADGQLGWINTIRGNGTESLLDIGINEKEEIYCIGDASNSTSLFVAGEQIDLINRSFVLKFDANGSNIQINNDHNSFNSNISITFDKNDNYYVLGGVRSNTNIGNQIFTSFGNSTDIIISKYNSNDERQWTVRGGGANIVDSVSFSDVGLGLKVLKEDEIYIWGTFRGETKFGEDITLNSEEGTQDFFLTRFGSPGISDAGRIIYSNETVCDFSKIGQVFNPISINNDYDSLEVITKSLPTLAPLKNLEAYLLFNNSLTDWSGYSNHAEGLNFAFEPNRYEIANGALSFANAEATVTLSNRTLHNATDFSTSFWIKSNQLGAALLSATNIYGGNDPFAILLGETGAIEVSINNSLDSLPPLLEGNSFVADDEWHHIVVVQSTITNTLNLFIDGKVDASTSFTYNPQLNIAEEGLVLGNYQSCGIGCFNNDLKYNGLLDDLYIFREALSSSEINTLLNEPPLELLSTTVLDTLICEGENMVVGDSEFTTAGTYDVTLTNVFGCDSIVTLNLTVVNALGFANAGMDFIQCADNTASLIATLPAGAVGRWTSLGEANLNDETSPISQVINLEIGENLFVWTIASERCGAMDSDTISINHQVAPIVLPDQFETFIEEPLQENLIANDDLSQVNDWTISLLTNTEKGIVTLNEDGTFSYDPERAFCGEVNFQYQICNVDCPELCDVGVVTIEVNIESDFGIGAPNVITPNGDKYNENFIIPDLFAAPNQFPNNKLTIVNQWGGIVYETNNYQNDWNGVNKNGKELPQATYYYVFDFGDGREKVSGKVVILK